MKKTTAESSKLTSARERERKRTILTNRQTDGHNLLRTYYAAVNRVYFYTIYPSKLAAAAAAAFIRMKLLWHEHLNRKRIRRQRDWNGVQQSSELPLHFPFLFGLFGGQNGSRFEMETSSKESRKRRSICSEKKERKKGENRNGSNDRMNEHFFAAASIERSRLRERRIEEGKGGRGEAEAAELCRNIYVVCG